MMRLIAIAGLALLAPCLAAAQARQAEEFMAMIQRPLHYEVHPDRVEIKKDVEAGKRADGSKLTLDLYVPKKAGTQKLPVAILLHGGLPDIAPVRPSDWRMYRDWGVALAQSDVAAVMFNHRLGYPQRRIDEAMNEIDQVMQWLQRSATAQQLDTTRVTAIGFSAGGLLLPELVRRHEPGRIRAYAMFYPLFGIAQDEANSAEVVAKLRVIDVLPTLAERRTPVLIFRSGSDEVPGLLPVLDAAIAAALKQDVRLELINVPKAPHAFDSLRDDAMTRGAIARAIEFASGGGG